LMYFFTQSSVFGSPPIASLHQRLFRRFVRRSEIQGTEVEM